MDNIVSVVISTRSIDDAYLKHVSKAFSHPKTEIIVYENDGTHSLAQLYNKGLNESKNDIVIFMHDDLIIDTSNVSQKLVKLFEKNPEYGIIGVAGTNHMVNGMWWQIRESMQGQVRHLHNGKIHRNNYSKTFGDGLKEVVIVDGLFFAVCKSRIANGFDEEFDGFHFYDIPFCVTNFVNGVKIGVTTKVLLTHKSIGVPNEQWHQNKAIFEVKYSKIFPLMTQEILDQK